MKVESEVKDNIISSMNRFICATTKKYIIPGYDYLDIKQQISLFILEGIDNYSQEHISGASIHSFLKVHVNNKMLNLIQHFDRKKYTTSIDTINYVRAICSCGNETFVNKNDISTMICGLCNNSNKIKIKNIKSRNISLDNEDECQEISVTCNFEKNLDIVKLIYGLSEPNKTIAKLIILKDYSYDDVSKIFGMSSWAISSRLKKLSTKKALRDFVNG